MSEHKLVMQILYVTCLYLNVAHVYIYIHFGLPRIKGIEINSFGLAFCITCTAIPVLDTHSVLISYAYTKFSDCVSMIGLHIVVLSKI